MSTAGKPTEDTRDAAPEAPEEAAPDTGEIEDAEIVDAAEDAAAEPQAEEAGDEPAGESGTAEEEDEPAAQADREAGHVAAAPEEPVAMAPPPPVEVPRIRRGPGFFTMLVGGILAGLAGYILAYATEFRPLSALIGGFDPRTEIVSLNTRLNAQGEDLKAATRSAGAAADAAAAADARAGAAAEAARAAGAQAASAADRIGGLQAKVDALTPGVDDIPAAVLDRLRSAAMGEVTALTARVSAAEAGLAELKTEVADLAARIEALGGVQAGATDEQLSAYESQLAALQAQLDAQRADIAAARTRAEELNAAAEAQQRALLAEAALARVRAAVSGGGTFDGALADLAAASDVALPEILTRVATTGLRTLPQLQDSFPAAARAGLEAAIEAEAGTGTAMERLGKFLRAQSGARSLREREGDDPDAVLSRVEARLNDGDLNAALAELDALNEAGKQAMSDWIDAARTRADALAAVEDLSAALAAE